MLFKNISSLCGCTKWLPDGWDLNGPSSPSGPSVSWPMGPSPVLVHELAHHLGTRPPWHTGREGSWAGPADTSFGSSVPLAGLRLHGLCQPGFQEML